MRPLALLLAVLLLAACTGGTSSRPSGDNSRYRECVAFWDPHGIRTEHARQQCAHLR